MLQVLGEGREGRTNLCGPFSLSYHRSARPVRQSWPYKPDIVRCSHVSQSNTLFMRGNKKKKAKREKGLCFWHSPSLSSLRFFSSLYLIFAFLKGTSWHVNYKRLQGTLCTHAQQCCCVKDTYVGHGQSCGVARWKWKSKRKKREEGDRVWFPDPVEKIGGGWGSLFFFVSFCSSFSSLSSQTRAAQRRPFAVSAADFWPFCAREHGRDNPSSRN